MAVFVHVSIRFYNQIYVFFVTYSTAFNFIAPYTLQNNKYWSLKGNISQKVFKDVKKLGSNAQVPEIRSQISYSIYLIDNNKKKLYHL